MICVGAVTLEALKSGYGASDTVKGAVAVLFVSPAPAGLYSKILFPSSVDTVTVKLPTLAEPSGIATTRERLRLCPAAMTPAVAAS